MVSMIGVHMWKSHYLLIVAEEQACTSDMLSVSVQELPSVGSKAIPDTSSVDVQILPEDNSVPEDNN